MNAPTRWMAAALAVLGAWGIGPAAAGPPASASWTAQPPVAYPAANLYGYIDGGAELFLEFGFDRLTVERHRRGKDEITVETYRMASPEAALGIYLMKRGDEAPVNGVPARNTGSPFQIVILKGRCFVQVNNPRGDASMVPAMADLARRALAKVDDEKPRDLLATLPAAGRVPGSELLIRGPYGLQSIVTLGEGDPLSLAGRTFAVAADYRAPDSSVFTRLAAVYPSPAAAAAAFSILCRGLDSTLSALEKRADVLVFRDPKGRFGKVQVAGDRLDLQLNLGSRP